MKSSSFIRRGLLLAAALSIALVSIIAALSAALDAGYLRRPLLRFLEAHTGRKIQIDGGLKTHVFSLSPRVLAERVTIGNPPWTSSGVTAEIEELSLEFHMPGSGHSFGIQRLEMQAATLHLIRDTHGRANWQRTDPDKGPSEGAPLIRSLSMRHARVTLDDELRHVQFNGTVSADDANATIFAEKAKETRKLPPVRIEGAGDSPLLRIEAAGELNGRAVTLEINGDPLAGAAEGSPYGFNFSEHSSGSRLIGYGSLLHAFNFDALDITFEASGEDLKDLFFLTGVTLVNTGAYRVSGRLARRGTHTQYSELVAASGQSDVRGTVSIETSNGRPKFTAELDSQILRLADLGERAAGRQSDPEAGKLLLSNASLSPRALRHGDWVVQFHARRVDVSRVSLHAVSAKVTIDHGIMVAAPVSADALDGKLAAHFKMDARTDTPVSDLDLKLTDVQIGQFNRKDGGPPPIEGSLQARVRVTGRGPSVHQIAASANGTVTAVLPHGAIRSSMAELLGMDLRGLGLMLTKNRQETGIRCAVGSFQAHDGTLSAQSLVVDTDPVLITGEGLLHLDSESLDFVIHGHPKSVRLFRLRAPVLVRGTLAHPDIGIGVSHAVAQAGGALALSVVLTPLAAVLAFVDPGLAKDADCASLQTKAVTSAR
jgi:uncharacterized protein involved in outer membrane biogenesis